MVAGILSIFQKQRDPQKGLFFQILNNEKWEFGVKGLVPVLYADVTDRSIQTTTALANALAEHDIEFSDRVRSSNGRRVVEVQGGDFAKLSQVIGIDRVNGLQNDIADNEIKAANWQFAVKGMAPVLYVDLNEMDPHTGRSLEGALAHRGIEANTRTRTSNGHRVLEVMGSNMLAVNDLVDHPELSNPIQPSGQDNRI